MNNAQLLHAMYGGKNGGVNIASGTTTGTYDFIIVESGVTFTVLADNSSVPVNLLTGKNLTGVAFAAERILNAGTGKKIKSLTFTGGLVWGYTIETSSV